MISRPRVAIIGGAGALGAVVATSLYEADHNVLIVDRNEESIGRIHSEGLLIQNTAGHSGSVPIMATSSFSELEDRDLVIFCTRAYHLPYALAQANPFLEQIKATLFLQGGWIYDLIAPVSKHPDRVLIGQCLHQAVRLAPARVLHRKIGLTTIGHLDGTQSLLTREVASYLDGASFPTNATDNLASLKWREVCLIASLDMVAVAHKVSLEAALKNLETCIQIEAVLEEALQIVGRLGIPIAHADIWNALVQRSLLAPNLTSVNSRRISTPSIPDFEPYSGALVRAGLRLGLCVEQSLELIRHFEPEWRPDVLIS